MRLRLAIFAAVLAGNVNSALATTRITEDLGGQIGEYVQAYSALKSSGERVVVDGDCLSACTLLLAFIPGDRMCATPRARFGFHAAWMPNADGHRVSSARGTRTLLQYYRGSVRGWISRHGGLSQQMKYLRGRELEAIVRPCDHP